MTQFYYIFGGSSRYFFISDDSGTAFSHELLCCTLEGLTFIDCTKNKVTFYCTATSTFLYLICSAYLRQASSKTRFFHYFKRKKYLFLLLKNPNIRYSLAFASKRKAPIWRLFPGVPRQARELPHCPPLRRVRPRRRLRVRRAIRLQLQDAHRDFVHKKETNKCI